MFCAIQFLLSKEMTGAIISVHVGQAGIQIGNAVWELYCLENDIGLDGRAQTSASPGVRVNRPQDLFHENEHGRVTPRAVYVDLDCEVTDQVKSGRIRELFSNEQLICGRSSGASNF